MLDFCISKNISLIKTLKSNRPNIEDQALVLCLWLTKQIFSKERLAVSKPYGSNLVISR